MRRDGEYLFGRKYFLERSTGTGVFLRYIQPADKNKEYWKLVYMNKFRHAFSLCLNWYKQSFPYEQLVYKFIQHFAKGLPEALHYKLEDRLDTEKALPQLHRLFLHDFSNFISS